MDKDDPFKVLYGVEGYVVDDLTEIAVNAKDQTLDDTYIVFDIETTGFSSIRDRIIEIGAVKVENGQIVDKFSTFVNPERPIPFEITNLTSITDHKIGACCDKYNKNITVFFTKLFSHGNAVHLLHKNIYKGYFVGVFLE